MAGKSLMFALRHAGAVARPPGRTAQQGAVEAQPKAIHAPVGQVIKSERVTCVATGRGERDSADRQDGHSQMFSCRYRRSANQ